MLILYLFSDGSLLWWLYNYIIILYYYSSICPNSFLQLFLRITMKWMLLHYTVMCTARFTPEFREQWRYQPFHDYNHRFLIKFPSFIAIPSMFLSCTEQNIAATFVTCGSLNRSEYGAFSMLYFFVFYHCWHRKKLRFLSIFYEHTVLITCPYMQFDSAGDMITSSALFICSINSSIY